jgi:hypothetical protein
MTVFGPPNGNPSPETVATCLRLGNAAFIVKACNAHEELMKVLREGIACFPKTQWSRSAKEALAIAKAEGKV